MYVFLHNIAVGQGLICNEKQRQKGIAIYQIYALFAEKLQETCNMFHLLRERPLANAPAIHARTGNDSYIRLLVGALQLLTSRHSKMQIRHQTAVTKIMLARPQDIALNQT